jgi:hypothetical protein
MRVGSGRLRVAGSLLALAVWPASRAAAQAFTAPQGVGSVTLAWQYIDNTGHRLSDGYFFARGDSATTSLSLDVDYAATDRLSASVGIPYIFAKYTGALPPPSGLPVDECQCWHAGFGDLSAAVRYRFGGETWALTPVAKLGEPSHAYPYQGEAVVGKRLSELQLGALAGLRLVELLPRATVQAGYTYAFVEKALDDVSVNRSNVFVDLGYAASRRLYVRGAWLWAHTHGGLRFGSPTGDPFFPPGEYDTPERRLERDRLGRVRYMQLVGGVAWNAGPVDVFASYANYVWGRDAHNGWAISLGGSWYFGLPD